MDSFARFAVQGSGTPAPVFPTKHLVVTGLYRFVRNPMYVAVVSVILGQGLLLGNVRILEYGVLVWLAFHLFVLAYEGPKLRVSFGLEYEQFCAGAPRWMPRLRPLARSEREGLSCTSGAATALPVPPRNARFELTLIVQRIEIQGLQLSANRNTRKAVKLRMVRTPWSRPHRRRR